MGIDADQVREDVIRPVLKAIGLWSLSAENLLLGTCAQESAMGTYIKQIGGGPALGIYQMEPATYNDIWNNYLPRKHELRDIIADVCTICNYEEIPSASRLMHNIAYATAMARIHYLRVPEILPQADSVKDLARYWKRYYNTPKGKGTIKEFIENYQRYVTRET